MTDYGASVEWTKGRSRVLVEPVRWEAAGTYRDCWNGTKYAVAYKSESRLEGDGAAVDLASYALDLMSTAHVVTCSQEQCEALPFVGDYLPQYGRYLALPFDPTFLSLGDARYADGWRASGVVLTQEDEGIMVVPVVRGPNGQVAPAGSIPAWETDATNAVRILRSGEAVEGEGPGDTAMERAALFATERAMAVLALIDGTAGVELVPASVSRQVRRAAERNGARVALTVSIRASSRSSEGDNRSVDYSHRFERRAHFACITKGAKFKEDKLASWCPRHGIRRCRREYRSSTIIGPVGKPFVPKVRRVDGE